MACKKKKKKSKDRIYGEPLTPKKIKENFGSTNYGMSSRKRKVF